VSDSGSVFEKLRARGEEMFTQISAQLMSNPQFVKAMEGAMRGKEKLDEAVGRALKQMNIPTRTEFKKAMSRIEALEQELAGLKAKPKRARRPRKPKPRTASE
jgi:polyhydroxyalkanoate synthesis regulator phasin